MLFLINNPIIAVILLIAVGFSIVIIKQIVDELKLNSALKYKQKSMRIHGNNFGVTKRVSALGALSLAPISVFVIALVVGLNLAPDTTNSNVLEIKSSADILSIYEDFTSKWSSSYARNGLFFTTDDVLEMAPDAMQDDSSGDEGSDDHSEVNNQVVGVDEMDNVITDGLYIYSIYGNEVQVSKAWTQSLGSGALELLHTFTYSTEYGCDQSYFYPIGLYEHEDKLIVVGSETTYTCVNQENGEVPYYDYWWGYNYYQQTTKVYVYDKSDFSLENEYSVKGNFIGTRKVNEDLYIVTNQYIPFNEEELDLDSYLPYFEVDEQKVTVQYEDIIYVEGTTPNSFTAFYAIDLNNHQVDMEVVLGDSGYNLYVSKNNMYLVGNIYYFWPVATLIDVEDPVYEQKTAIMRVEINDTDVEYSGIGYVDGYIENQFSMDEYNGFLRVTTTVGWWGDVVNYLWVLDTDLEVVGQLGGRDLPDDQTIGKPGERIRSTRFAGDYVYVVTYLQTDPFYVINASDPENPFIEGSLEITGYSEHLQVLDENHVLGIGYEATNEGTIIGLKFNIYDVTDKSNPVEAFATPTTFYYEDLGYAYTSALWNHKDLLVSLDKGILAMPFSSYKYDETAAEYNWSYTSGILLFDLSIEEGIGDYDFLIHEQNANFDCYVYKSVFIEDQFYTISNKYIKVSSLEDPTVFTNSITLREFDYQNNPTGDPVEAD